MLLRYKCLWTKCSGPWNTEARFTYREIHHYLHIAKPNQRWVNSTEHCFREPRIDNQLIHAPLQKSSAQGRGSHGKLFGSGTPSISQLQRHHYTNERTIQVSPCLSNYTPRFWKTWQSHKKHFEQTNLLSYHNHLQHRVNFCLAVDQSIAKALAVTVEQGKKKMQKQ